MLNKIFIFKSMVAIVGATMILSLFHIINVLGVKDGNFTLSPLIVYAYMAFFLLFMISFYVIMMVVLFFFKINNTIKFGIIGFFSGFISNWMCDIFLELLNAYLDGGITFYQMIYFSYFENFNIFLLDLISSLICGLLFVAIFFGKVKFKK